MAKALLREAIVFELQSGLMTRPDGAMIEDFKIEYKDNSIHVLNAPSPAATSCLAIGEAVSEMAEKHFQLKEILPTV